MVQLPRNEKQYRLNSRPQMWPIGLTLAMTLTLNYQGQIYNLLYLSQKWPDCHETKSKHINWTQGLKCDIDLWLHTWPWPWIAVISEWEGRLTLNTGGGSRSFMTTTVTIWWPRSDVRICQIITAVISDVTHLVYTNNDNYEADDIFKSFNSLSSWPSLFGATWWQIYWIEIYPPNETYCSFNNKFEGVLILMQCINKLYLSYAVPRCPSLLPRNSLVSVLGYINLVTCDTTLILAHNCARSLYVFATPQPRYTTSCYARVTSVIRCCYVIVRCGTRTCILNIFKIQVRLKKSSYVPLRLIMFVVLRCSYVVVTSYHVSQRSTV